MGRITVLTGSNSLGYGKSPERIFMETRGRASERIARDDGPVNLRDYGSSLVGQHTKVTGLSDTVMVNGRLEPVFDQPGDLTDSVDGLPDEYSEYVPYEPESGLIRLVVGSPVKEKVPAVPGAMTRSEERLYLQADLVRRRGKGPVNANKPVQKK